MKLQLRNAFVGVGAAVTAVFLSSAAEASNEHAAYRGTRVGPCVNASNLLGEQSVDVEASLSQLATAGIKTIRLPVPFDRFSTKHPPYEIEPSFLERVRTTVESAAALDIDTIVDFHDNKDLKRTPTPKRIKRHAKIWGIASERMSDIGDNLFFEVLNEPGLNLTKKDNLELIKLTADEIWRFNTKRRVIISGLSSSHYASMDELRELTDPRFIPTFHFYEPMNVTHRGAPWSAKYRDVWQEYDASVAERAVAEAKRAVATFMQRYPTAPLLGEFGIINNVDGANRSEYLRKVYSEFSAMDITSCAWTWSSRPQMFTVDFQIFQN